MAVVYSYIIMTIINIVAEFFKCAIEGTWLSILLAIAIAALWGLFVLYLKERKWYVRILSKLNHKAVCDVIWHDIVDFDKGTSVTVYLKNNTQYIGYLYEYEENGADSWISIFQPILVEANGKRRILNADGMKFSVAFSLREISSIVLGVEADSGTIT